MAARVLALWCPDWPAVAAAAALGVSASRPVAVLAGNRVVACTAVARAEGVRRGYRKREAQARCPELVVTQADPDRDARLFEPVAAAVDAVTPGVEVLRPGLAVLPARGPVRYFGSETAAAERLIDAVAQLGVECQAGIADELSTAVIAARRSTLVEPGRGASFLAPLAVTELAGEPALAAPERLELVDLLHRLGLRTIGAFAAVPAKDVGSRFGADAMLAHRSARALPERAPAVRAPPADLMVEISCDPPIERVDAAAFAGRALAVKLHAKLLAANVACTRLLVTAYSVGGTEMARTWRCADPLTPAATADRVRWQLSGWLAGQPAARSGEGDNPATDFHPYEDQDSGIIRLRLAPVEVVEAGVLQLRLWGGPTGGDERARRALIRVQGLLGGDAVRVGVLSGGRGPAERITLVSFGDELVPAADPALPWPGRLPAPAPGALPSPVWVRLLDGTGAPITVTERGFLSGVPAQLRWEKEELPVLGWAGPWLLDEYWWADGIRDGSPGQPVARMQLLAGARQLFLVRYQRRGWAVEGLY